MIIGNLQTGLLVLALLLFGLAACNVYSRANLVAAGLACWVLSLLMR